MDTIMTMIIIIIIISSFLFTIARSTNTLARYHLTRSDIIDIVDKLNGAQEGSNVDKWGKNGGPNINKKKPFHHYARPKNLVDIKMEDNQKKNGNEFSKIMKMIFDNGNLAKTENQQPASTNEFYNKMLNKANRFQFTEC